MFWEDGWKRERILYIAKGYGLYAFKCNKYGFIEFIIIGRYEVVACYIQGAVGV